MGLTLEGAAVDGNEHVPLLDPRFLTRASGFYLSHEAVGLFTGHAAVRLFASHEAVCLFACHEAGDPGVYRRDAEGACGRAGERTPEAGRASSGVTSLILVVILGRDKIPGVVLGRDRFLKPPGVQVA